MQEQNEILKRRTVQTRSPFFLPVAVPFTSVVNEVVQASTTPSSHPGVGDMEILGMTADLVNVTSSFKLNKRSMWSDDRVPLPIYFGKPDSPKPVRWLEVPLLLLQGYRIYADLLNVGGEPAGTLVFVGRVKDALGPQVLVNDGEAIDDVIEIDSNFTGTLNEEQPVPSAILNEDFLVDSLHTNLTDASVEIVGAHGTPWMEAPVPLWAIAGRGTSDEANQRLKQPYLIPARSKILVKFHNVGTEASGQLYLKGRRLSQR